MSAENILGFAWKTVATAVVMLVVMVVISGLTLPPGSMEAAPDDGAGTLLYLFVITLVDALILNTVITQTRWRGLPLALGLTFAFYGVQTVVGMIASVILLRNLAPAEE